MVNYLLLEYKPRVLTERPARDSVGTVFSVSQYLAGSIFSLGTRFSPVGVKAPRQS